MILAKQTKFHWVWLLVALGLVACQASQPSTAVTVERPTQTAVLPTVIFTPVLPTETAVPPTTTLTLVLPTETAVLPTTTPRPTNTPVPTYTPRPTRTSVPTATAPAYPQTHAFFELVTILPEEFPNRITELRFSPTEPNLLQLITNDGYFLVDPADGQLTSYLLAPDATLVGVDNNNVMWFFQETGEAIYAWDGVSTERRFGLESGWVPVDEYEQLAGSGLVQDGNGHLWLATSQDVRRFDGAQWTVYTREMLGMPSPELEGLFTRFTLMYSTMTNTIWAGECEWGGPGPLGGAGVRWFDGTIWHGGDSPVAAGCATGMVEAGNGRIWLAVGSTVWQFNPADSSWQSFAPVPPQDTRTGYTEQLWVDANDTPWLLYAPCGGGSCAIGYAIYRLDGPTWTPIGDMMPDIPRLVFSPSGTVFQFQYLQMFSYAAGDEFIQLSEFEMFVQAALADTQNGLWIVALPSSDLPWGIWYAPVIP